MALTKISKGLKDAVKLSTFNQYTIANRAGLSQSMMSQLLNEIAPHQEDDPRVIAIGKVVGVEPEDCFE